MEAAAGTLDGIVDTVSAKHDLGTYLSLLKTNGAPCSDAKECVEQLASEVESALPACARSIPCQQQGRYVPIRCCKRGSSLSRHALPSCCPSPCRQVCDRGCALGAL